MNRELYIASLVGVAADEFERASPDLTMLRKVLLELAFVATDLDRELETLRAGAGKYDGMTK